MIKLEEITSLPKFSDQLENKLLYSNHSEDISISYKSTYTIKFVIDGLKNYNYDNRDIKVEKNQYLILNNDSLITTEAKKDTKGISLFLSLKLIDDIFHFQTNEKKSIKFLEILQKNSNQNIYFLLKEIAYLYENNQIALIQQIDDLFIKISELIVQEQISIDTNFSNLKIIKHDTKRELYKLIMDAKEYLNDNFKEKITLDIISKDIGISKYYLHRLFREINKNTPLDYLTIIRLEHAKNKLKSTKETIFEIAINCGFDNTAYFSNSFKKYTGFTPSKFRRLY
ncbi:helix-turn-helix transcriptional regulator [Aureivirga sp. CE67]|uniref:helix-turn-helix transcriptional regulator n=1 Tax=Aureivirga sp. CE67 TaxID=1788983 RepID=UPI0018C96213|nr:AraC family transcriptional regulator [Aureivirga sp. CE67]